jgi:hypothetical protein
VLNYVLIYSPIHWTDDVLGKLLKHFSFKFYKSIKQFVKLHFKLLVQYKHLIKMYLILEKYTHTAFANHNY